MSHPKGIERRESAQESGLVPGRNENSPWNPSWMLSRSRESAGKARGLCVDRTLYTSSTGNATYSQPVRPHCTLTVLPSTTYLIGMNAMTRSASTNTSTQNESSGFRVARLIHSVANWKHQTANSASHQSILDRNTFAGPIVLLCSSLGPSVSNEMSLSGPERGPVIPERGSASGFRQGRK